MTISAFSPFKTYSQSEGRLFLDSKGKPVSRDQGNPDLGSLWEIGRNAYEMLNIKDQKDFNERYERFRESVLVWKQFLTSLTQGNMLAFQHGGSITDEKLALDELGAYEILSITWEIVGKLPEQGIVIKDDLKGELWLFACLTEIDNALIEICMGGPDAMAFILDAAKALSNAQAIYGESDTYKKARREMAAQGAMAKHENDPKQKEKQFVRECYLLWKQQPDRYKSKAAFARDMLDKCDHLVSQKKIEDWVREWSRETNENGTLPAE